MTDRPERLGKWMRMIARGLGSLAAALWLLTSLASGLGSLFSGEPPEAPALGAVLTGLVAASAICVGIAWRRERLGGAVLLVSAIALAVFAYVTAGHNKLLAVGISADPFLLAAILFLASSARSSHATE